MNDAQHAALEPYIRNLADRMSLRDWRIVLLSEPPANPSHIACAQRTYGRKVLTIQFAAEFFTVDEETRRHTCVHELLHAHINAVYDVIANVSGALGSVAYQMLDGAMDDAVEYMTDGLADAIAPLMPLPPAVRDL